MFGRIGFTPYFFEFAHSCSDVNNILLIQIVAEIDVSSLFFVIFVEEKRSTALLNFDLRWLVGGLVCLFSHGILILLNLFW